MMPKNRNFTKDLVNCKQIRQKKFIFKECVDEYKTRVMLIDMQEQKKAKEKEEKENSELENRAKKLKDKLNR